MLIPALVAPVFITEQLGFRPSLPPDFRQENIAIQDLARLMADDPKAVLPQLVDLAISMCSAVAGGLSIYERENKVFRWHHLRGTLAAFTGATTPRDYSPCGITMDHRTPILVQRPERVYSWLVDAGVSLPECLLVPLYVRGEELIGTLWIVSEHEGHFTSAHSHTMQELASFTGIALRMIQSEERLNAALSEQETLAQEMGHRVKNLFTIADAMIRLSARGSSTKEEMAESLAGRLQALASANSLIKRSFNDGGKERAGSNLGAVIAAVLKPYNVPPNFDGDEVLLGERSTNSIALVFHELATNAAKYGALSSEHGVVTVDWKTGDGVLQVNWAETGGPAIHARPDKNGFGSSLVINTVQRSGGSIEYVWAPTGLVVSMKMPIALLAQ